MSLSKEQREYLTKIAVDSNGYSQYKTADDLPFEIYQDLRDMHKGGSLFKDVNKFLENVLIKYYRNRGEFYYPPVPTPRRPRRTNRRRRFAMPTFDELVGGSGSRGTIDSSPVEIVIPTGDGMPLVSVSSTNQNREIEELTSTTGTVRNVFVNCPCEHCIRMREEHETENAQEIERRLAEETQERADIAETFGWLDALSDMRDYQDQQ